MKEVLVSLESLIHRHPSTGYIGAIVPAGAGFWVWVDGLTKIGAALSILIGIAVGIITLLVQLNHLRKDK